MYNNTANTKSNKVTEFITSLFSRTAKVRFLIVDDNKLNRNIAEKTLFTTLKKLNKSKNVTIEKCESGELAIQKMKEGNRYDFILLDNQLGENRWSGGDVAKEIRAMELTNNLQYSYIVTWSADENIRKYSNADDMIKKPIDTAELKECLIRSGCLEKLSPASSPLSNHIISRDTNHFASTTQTNNETVSFYGPDDYNFSPIFRRKEKGNVTKSPKDRKSPGDSEIKPTPFKKFELRP